VREYERVVERPVYVDKIVEDRVTVDRPVYVDKVYDTVVDVDVVREVERPVY